MISYHSWYVKRSSSQIPGSVVLSLAVNRNGGIDMEVNRWAFESAADQLGVKNQSIEMITIIVGEERWLQDEFKLATGTCETSHIAFWPPFGEQNLTDTCDSVGSILVNSWKNWLVWRMNWIGKRCFYIHYRIHYCYLQVSRLPYRIECQAGHMNKASRFSALLWANTTTCWNGLDFLVQRRSQWGKDLAQHTSKGARESW
jgi:hypothetical protein